MTAIKYVDTVPRLRGEKRRILIDAAYADNGKPTYENWGEVFDDGGVDLPALEQLRDGAVWIGEGSPWALPEGWDAEKPIWVTGERSFDGTSPLGVNRALWFTIRNELPWYPTAANIRDALGGKRLAVQGERGDITHADVLVAVAAGRVWRP